MRNYIGIDLGTSSVKILLVDEEGKILKTATRDYPLIFPNPGWTEQEPELWWNATLEALEELLSGTDRTLVDGIGVGGQMHGLVILDRQDRVIRPAILWNDGRTGEEVEYLNSVIGKEKISECTANIAFAGFTAPKLLWLKKHEKENFERISKIMLPKDYINYLLTGVHSCDYSDASGMLLLDVKNRRWSEEMLKICSVREDQMPSLYESYQVTGTLKKEVAQKLGLRKEVCVTAGAGDNAAAAVGTGTTGDGECNISLGTSGTLFITSDKFRVDNNNGLHAFCHADGKYHLMGCMLSSASCNKWFYEEILKTDDYNAEQAGITDRMLGNNRVFFLPYLMGERSPINDTDARGTFTGLSMDTTRTDMVLSILEGVAFAARDNLEIVKKLGIDVKKSKICGGGARSRLWVKILANVLGIELEIPQTEEGPGYGAAMLSMVGCGRYKSVKEACDNLIKTVGTVYPDREISQRYEKAYGKYRKIYPALKNVFPELK
ncbi:MAG: xylulokinase [Sphaerochaetaceae bacterium]|nr:xylulokinase [Sphaerochaetaceae bacterium]